MQVDLVSKSASSAKASGLWDRLRTAPKQNGEAHADAREKAGSAAVERQEVYSYGPI